MTAFKVMGADYLALIDEARRRQRVTVALLRCWRDTWWMLDAGTVAEATFNLVSDGVLASGAMHDALMKLSLLEPLSDGEFVQAEEFEALIRSCLIAEDIARNKGPTADRK